jgi:predicted SAM-dependent methyltransferase
VGLHQLNVGSGQRPFATPFTNIDSNPRWNADLICDAGRLPYSSGSCSLIISHHQLEHVELSKADDMLREWYRLLAPGGSLLIFVPDLWKLTVAWNRGDIDDYTFCVNLYGAWMGDEADLHRWGYHRQSLTKKLEKVAPWREIKLFDYEKIEGADLARDWWILAMRAIK